MATSLGKLFSTAENQVPQCDDQTLGSITEALVIHFNQEKFEQLLFGGSTSPPHVCKHMNVSVARAPLATSWKKVSVKTTEVLCRPIIASCEAKQSLREPITVSIKTNLAPY